jgi:formyltetrahydrofolate deformylase
MRFSGSSDSTMYRRHRNGTARLLRQRRLLSSSAMSPTLLKLSCPDRVGVLATLSSFVARHGGNLVEVNQFTDTRAKWFFARMAIETQTLQTSPQDFRDEFASLARQLQAEWTIRAASHRMKVVIMVSKLGHCLADLFWRWRSGELACDIALVIGNHNDLREMTEREQIKFKHVPVQPDETEASFRTLGELLRETQPDLVILARYMRILPPNICAELVGRIINIHHSFLPSFAGANAYAKAYDRGVKLIGATCHYATADLDAGPIIDQEVVRVEHFHSLDDLVRLGRDCERLALARSVRWHLEDRVLIHGDRSIVFRD